MKTCRVTAIHTFETYTDLLLEDHETDEDARRKAGERIFPPLHDRDGDMSEADPEVAFVMWRHERPKLVSIGHVEMGRPEPVEDEDDA